MQFGKTKTKISIVSVSIFLAIICAILFSLQNYSKVELAANAEEMVCIFGIKKEI